MSRGEELIAKLLTQAKIPFQKEKTFYDLKKGTYRYDFYVELPTGHAIVEYNGEQHYWYVSTFYQSPRMWIASLERDRRKISYALANDIPMYIIPYWEYGNLKSAKDLFKPEFRAKTRWHNDDVKQSMKKKK